MYMHIGQRASTSAMTKLLLLAKLALHSPLTLSVIACMGLFFLVVFVPYGHFALLFNGFFHANMQQRK